MLKKVVLQSSKSNNWLVQFASMASSAASHDEKPNLAAGPRASRTRGGNSIANEMRESKTKVIHKNNTFGLPEF
jgi:hypothetical protein